MPTFHSRLRGALILLLLLSYGLSHNKPSAASSSLAVTPTVLTATLPLGGQQTYTLTLQNQSSSAMTPAVYEAQSALATTSALQAIGPQQVTLPAQTQRIDPLLQQQLSAGGKTTFFVYLNEQANLSAAYQISDWDARGRFVYQTLYDFAEQKQAALRAELDQSGQHYQSLWIVNALLVQGDAVTVQQLSTRADIALIRANQATALPESVRTSDSADRCSPDQENNPLCWNIRQIGADRVWSDFGVNGSGIVVANIDTGVSATHPALRKNYRGYQGSNDFNWFDPLGANTSPTDENGHGTHTMGTIVGEGNGTSSQPSIGAAPGSTWIAAQGCSVFLCSESDLLLAAQWMLAPTRIDGSDPRPDLRPMIINNSWSGQGGNSWYAGYTAAWRAAGIFPIFAAGNAAGGIAPTCRSIGSPGDYADVVAVGATDFEDNIATFSLLGPSVDDKIKPDFTAPGTYYNLRQGVLSSYLDGGYQTLQGTSMAAPLVAGAVALLWSANPSLIGDYDQTYALLKGSSKRLSDTRCGDAPGAENNVYGYGRVDIYAAVAAARVDVPWLSVAPTIANIQPTKSASLNVTLNAKKVPGPGTYRARILVYPDTITQTPVSIPIVMTVTPVANQRTITGHIYGEQNASISATVGLAEALGVTTAADGSYSLTLVPGSYDLIASAPSYLSAKRSITIADSNLQLSDIVLVADLPRLAITSFNATSAMPIGAQQTVSLTLSNNGTQPLYYSTAPIERQFTITRSDTNTDLKYAWVQLPTNATRVTLGDNAIQSSIPLGFEFPIYGYIITETLITSDGMLSFFEPPSYDGPLGRCLPEQSLPFYTIAPFRVDLDPSRGGTIRYATLADQGVFVVSYEQIPLHDGPLDQTYSFQTLFYHDGSIRFQYRDLPNIPPTASAGIQHLPSSVEGLGCGTTLAVSPGLAVEFRPQPEASLWSSIPSQEGEIAAGKQATISVVIRWTRPLGDGIYQGSVLISNNDPRQPKLQPQFQVQMLPAPYEQNLITVHQSNS